jgi:hypothetical protein
MLETDDIPKTVDIKVLVQFQLGGGRVKQGDFMGVFKRVPQSKVAEMFDDEWSNSEVIDEVLVGAKGIGKKDGDGKLVEMSADEGLAWVRETPETVNAAVAAFFRTMRADRYDERTSRKRRRGG